jgi:hypothetical protein
MDVSAAMGVRDVPHAILSLSTMDPPDYVDLFVATAPEATRTPPEAWARIAMDGAPALGRFVAWRVLCGLRLHAQPSPDHVAGWKITGRGEHWIRTEARSRLMTAHIVFATEESRVSFATFIRYDRPIAAWTWGVVSVIHRTVAPGFLRGAVKRVNRARSRPGHHIDDEPPPRASTFT